MKKIRDIIKYYNSFIKNASTGKTRFFIGSLAFLKSAVLLLSGKTIKSKQISTDYDYASNTYFQWEELMGRHVNKMIYSALKAGNTNDVKILDLACGQGYVTDRILKEVKNGIQIACVDASEKMLAKCKARINDERVDFIHEEAIFFLKKQKANTYDLIFLSWALPYINHNKLIKLFRKVLKPGGIAGVISNSIGTLKFIDNVFIEIMVNKRKK